MMDDTVLDKRINGNMKGVRTDLTRKRETIITDPEKHDMIDRFPGLYLPQSVRSLHGCVNCEWRGTNECPFGFDGGKVIYCGRHRNVSVTDNHGFRICMKRINHLKSIIPDAENKNTRDKSLTYSQWLQMYMISKKTGMGVKQFKIYEDLMEKKVEIETQYKNNEIDDNNYNAAMKTINKQIYYAKKEASVDYNDIMKYVDKQVDRETPKEVKMDIRRTPSIQDIMASIKDEPIDADFETIDDETEED
jgi:hypothetical protein